MASDYTGWPDERVPVAIRAMADLLAAGEPEDAVNLWFDRTMAEIEGTPRRLPRSLGRVYDDRFPYIGTITAAEPVDDES